MFSTANFASNPDVRRRSLNEPAASCSKRFLLAIARALVNQPPLILADEPTGCLDSRTGREVLDILLALKARGLTIFMVTHDAASAACADRILHLYSRERGRIGAIAKGVRKTRSRVGARLEPFSHVEVVLHEGRIAAAGPWPEVSPLFARQEATR